MSVHSENGRARTSNSRSQNTSAQFETFEQRLMLDGMTPQPNNLAPNVYEPISAVHTSAGSPGSVNALNHFADPDLVYHFDSNMGDVFVRMFWNEKYDTVVNFHYYADFGVYDNTIIHRSIPEFVVQGGGWTWEELGGEPLDDFQHIQRYAPIADQPGIANVRGTIAMATAGPNTATSQWFFNMVDNPFLDGGYTVFGTVIGDGMAVVDSIHDVPNENLFPEKFHLDDDDNTVWEHSFVNTPLRDIPEGGDWGDGFVYVNSISRASQQDMLTFEIVGNSNEDLVTATVDENGKLIITSAENQEGTAEITVRATDIEGATVEHTFTVVAHKDVVAVDDGLAVQIDEATPTNLDVRTNDQYTLGSSDLLTVTVAGDASHGTTTVVDDGTVSYVPDAGYAGPDEFTYTITDGNGTTDTGTVRVNVLQQSSPANQGPVVDHILGDVIVQENDPDTTMNLNTHFSDPDDIYVFNSSLGSFNVRLFSGFATGTAMKFRLNANAGIYDNTFIDTVYSTNDISALQGGTWMPNGSGGYVANTATPVVPLETGIHNARGTLAMLNSSTALGFSDAVSWLINRGNNSAFDALNGGQAVFGQVIGDGMNIVDAIYALPTAALPGDETLTPPLQNYTANQTPLDENLVTFSSIDAVTDKLTYEIVNSNPDLVTATVDDNGILTLDYAPDSYGQASLTVIATDLEGAQTSDTFTLDVMPRNVVANDDVLLVPADSGATPVDVLSNDTYEPDVPNVLNITAFTDANHGTVTLDAGVLTYAPDAEYHGTDTFTYEITDQNGLKDTGTVTVGVDAHTPLASDDTAAIYPDLGPTVIDVLNNDTAEPDANDHITITSVLQPSDGEVLIVDGGSRVTYQAAAGFVGQDTFTYTITDSTGLTATATVVTTSYEPKQLNDKGVAEFTDINGVPVKVSLRGGGKGTVYFDEEGNTAAILLRETTTKSSLTITTSGRGTATTVGGIFVEGSLKSFTGKTTTLTGNMEVTGLLNMLTLDNVNETVLIELNTGSLDIGTRDSLKATFDRVVDTSLDTNGIPIKSLTCTEWLDVDGLDNDEIIAPWIVKISTKGVKANAKRQIEGSDGNFQADLTLSDGDRRGNAVASVAVKGEIGCEWKVISGAGNFGRISANSMADTWTLTTTGFVSGITSKTSLGGQLEAKYYGAISCKGKFTASVKATGRDDRRFNSIVSLRVGEAFDADLDVPDNGGIGTITATDWQKTEGSDLKIKAGWIGSFTTKGARANLKRGILERAGNLNVNIETLGVDPRRKMSIGKLRIAGTVDASVKTGGDMGTVMVGQWKNGGILDVEGDIKGITTKGNKRLAIPLPGDFGANVLALGEVKKLSIAGDLTGNVSARTIKSAMVKGDMRGSHLDLTMAPDARLLALGKLFVKGILDKVRITSAGNIGRIMVGGSFDTTIFAGAFTQAHVESNGIFGLPKATSLDLAAGRTATIKSFMIKPRRGSTTPTYVNTNISAATIGSLSLGMIQNDNGGVPFGITADYIGKLSGTDDDGRFLLSKLDLPGDVDTPDDAKLRLI